MVHQKSYKLNIQIALYHGSIITSPYTGSMIIFLWTSERGLCGRGGTSLLLTWGTPVEEDEGASTIFRLTVNTTDPVCSSILFRTWVNDYELWQKCWILLFDGIWFICNYDVTFLSQKAWDRRSSFFSGIYLK